MSRYCQNLFIHQNPFKSKHQLLINGRKNVGTENFKNPKAFVDY